MKKTPAKINRKKGYKLKIEYGAGSSKYSIECEDKFVGYCAILLHYANSPGAVVIYSPEELKKDSWVSFSGKTDENIAVLFKKFGGFEPFIKGHITEMRTAYKTIKKLV